MNKNKKEMIVMTKNQMVFLEEKIEKVLEVFAERRKDQWTHQNSVTFVTEENKLKNDFSFFSDSGDSLAITYETNKIKGLVFITPDKMVKSWVDYNHSKFDHETKEVEFVLSWLKYQLENRL